MMQQATIQQAIASEKPMDKYVPFRVTVTDKVVKLGDGSYAQTWKVGGISFETVDEFYIKLRHDGFNQVLRSINTGGVSVWAHKVRREVSDRLGGNFPSNFSRRLNQRYFDSFEDYRMLALDMYMTIVYSPKADAPSVANIFGNVVAKSLDDIRTDQRKALKVMGDIARSVESSMRKYELEALGAYVENGIEYSSQLEFYGFLVNGVWEKIPLRRERINQYLPTSRLFSATEFLELRSLGRTQFVSILDFADYPEGSQPGILNPVLYEDFEYIETQSFTMLNKRDALEAMKRQRGYLIASEDGTTAQIEAIDKALEEVKNGTYVVGDYHYSLAVFGDTLEKVGKNVGKVRASLQEKEFQTKVIDLVPEAGWFAQLPGNWRYRPRTAKLSSRNFCGLSPFHNFMSGKRQGNPWGQAVTMLKTPSGQPLYVNFHVSPDEKDSEDDKTLGNTLIIGGSGEGKTLMKMLLISEATKFNPSGVFFDKDYGEEIALRAMGAKYLRLKVGEPTGCNPFQRDVTERNREFWNDLIKLLTRRSDLPHTPEQERGIYRAIETITAPSFPREIRGIKAVWQNLGDHDLRMRLEKWCWGQQYGWVLDCPVDNMNFSTHKLYGFDYTDFLDAPEIRTPLMMYLLHIMEELIDGRRFIYGMAEFWKPLEDSVFMNLAKNKQKTIRKQNGLGIFDTQSPSDALESPIAKTLIEQMATLIFLPNVRATRADYVDGFKLTEAEWEILSSFQEGSRMCLIKQGHRSAIASYGLDGFGEFIDVLSASTDNVELLQDVLKDVGEDPDVWLPELHRRIAVRRAEKR